MEYIRWITIWNLDKILRWIFVWYLDSLRWKYYRHMGYVRGLDLWNILRLRGLIWCMESARGWDLWHLVRIQYLWYLDIVN